MNNLLEYRCVVGLVQYFLSFHKLVIKSLKLLGRLLTLIGKPIYYVLASTIIGLLYVLELIGKIFIFLIKFAVTTVISFLDLTRTVVIAVLEAVRFMLFSLGLIISGLVKVPIRILLAILCKASVRSQVVYRSKPKYHKIIPGRFVAYSFLFLLIICVGLTVAFWSVILRDLPSPYELSTRPVAASTKIYDRNGQVLYKIYKNQNRTPVALDKIPIDVRLATLAIEDSEFYMHPGFSIRGIVRAMLRNVERGELTGGSTITQQLVKNALLTPEKTYTRKLREVTLATMVEMNFSKNEILEMYLNEVSYGGTAYGVQEASQMYFGKDVEKLTLAEAALLAGLPKSPTNFSPFGAHPEIAKVRQEQVLRLMEINGYISSEQKKIAENEELAYADNRIDILAPHFVIYTRSELENTYSPNLVETGGLEVVTTLDYDIQRLVQEIVTTEVENLSSLRVTNGAAVVADPKTGEILAMVGSKDFFDIDAEGNVNVTMSLRAPGSSIKVVNYANALGKGLTAASLVDDSPVVFDIAGTDPYKPQNYDGGYRGRLTIRSALAESRNIPAVKVLNKYGVNAMLTLGKQLGITTWTDPSLYGLSLTLGGGGVKLIDMVQVYAVLANYGKRVDLKTVKRITDFSGEVLADNECTQITKPVGGLADSLVEEAKAQTEKHATDCGGIQVIDPRVAYILTDILKDNEARSPAFGRNSLLNIDGHPEVAVKTGTSNDLRDNLAIGYSQDYVVGVWVGNNDNSSMSRVASGITGATPIFNKIMTALLTEQESREWEVPEGLTQLPICPYTGTLACHGCPVMAEWFIEGSEPDLICNPVWFAMQEKANENGEDFDGQIYDPAWEEF